MDFVGIRRPQSYVMICSVALRSFSFIGEISPEIKKKEGVDLVGGKGNPK